MKDNFDEFLSQLSETNATLDFFVNFEKVKFKTKSIEIKLNQLNYLLGKTDIKSAVFNLYQENPSVFEVLEVLIAVRKEKKQKILSEKGKFISLSSYLTSPEKVYEFIKGTGVLEIFKNKEITNLVDYVFGIEVGLDTNARKNRSGENMSKAVSLKFDNAGISYDKEVASGIFPDIKTLGVDIKVFDFVVRTNQKTFLIEVNFYNGGGSKLNEVARSYSDIAPKINQYQHYEFVWVTDGKGWLSAKNKLEEAYNLIPRVYNLSTIDEFIEEISEF